MKKDNNVSVVDQEETSTVFTSSSIATIPKEKLSAKERLLVSKALKQSKHNELKDTASRVGGYYHPPTPVQQPKKKRIGTLSDLDRLPGKQPSQTGGRSKASRSRNDKSTGGRSTEVRNVSPLSSGRSVSSSGGQSRFQRSQSNTNEDNPPAKSTFAGRRRRSIDSLQRLSVTLKEKNYK